MRSWESMCVSAFDGKHVGVTHMRKHMHVCVCVCVFGWEACDSLMALHLDLQIEYGLKTYKLKVLLVG